MASKAAAKRLGKEYVAMQKESPPFVWAAPEEKNILTWNYIVRGPPDSPYAGGEYHGVLLFPSEYPFKPPGIKMYTPSGRFQQDKRICMSMSDFHPGSWNPAWSVATILTGLLSFMLSDEMTTGSVTSSDADKKTYAAKSHAWNIEQRKFKEVFSDYCGATMKDLPNMGEKDRGESKVNAGSPSTAALSSSAASSSPTPTTTSTPTPTLTRRQATANDAAVRAGQGQVPTGEKMETVPLGVVTPKATSSWMWDKWRWGLLIVVAVVVSRLPRQQ